MRAPEKTCLGHLQDTGVVHVQGLGLAHSLTMSSDVLASIPEYTPQNRTFEWPRRGGRCLPALPRLGRSPRGDAFRGFVWAAQIWSAPRGHAIIQRFAAGAGSPARAILLTTRSLCLFRTPRPPSRARAMNRPPSWERHPQAFQQRRRRERGKSSRRARGRRGSDWSVGDGVPGNLFLGQEERLRGPS